MTNPSKHPPSRSSTGEQQSTDDRLDEPRTVRPSAKSRITNRPNISDRCTLIANATGVRKPPTEFLRGLKLN